MTKVVSIKEKIEIIKTFLQDNSNSLLEKYNGVKYQVKSREVFSFSKIKVKLIKNHEKFINLQLSEMGIYSDENEEEYEDDEDEKRKILNFMYSYITNKVKINFLSEINTYDYGARDERYWKNYDTDYLIFRNSELPVIYEGEIYFTTPGCFI